MEVIQNITDKPQNPSVQIDNDSSMQIGAASSEMFGFVAIMHSLSRGTQLYHTHALSCSLHHTSNI
jgi:hypothetical protein